MRSVIMIIFEIRTKNVFQVSLVQDNDMVKVFTANGPDESLNIGMQADHIETSLNNLQHWLCRRIQ